MKICSWQPTIGNEKFLGFKDNLARFQDGLCQNISQTIHFEQGYRLVEVNFCISW